MAIVALAGDRNSVRFVGGHRAPRTSAQLNLLTRIVERELMGLFRPETTTVKGERSGYSLCQFLVRHQR